MSLGQGIEFVAGHTLRRREQCLERRQETASDCVGPAWLVPAAHRIDRTHPAGDDQPIFASRRNRDTTACGWGRLAPAKPAIEVITDPELVPSRSLSVSSCEPFRDLVELGLSRGRNAMAIWQDLVSQYGHSNSRSTQGSACVIQDDFPACRRSPEQERKYTRTIPARRH
jgi:hypothetical protein